MNLSGATVAVTGATGFLGRYLVDVLLGRGARVIGVVRNPARVPELATQGVELRQADLAEPARLTAGFMGADALVSNAALFSLRNRDWEAHHQANINGTRNVLTAAADAGVTRIVHVSSVAVYDGHQAPVTEEHPQLSLRSRRNLFNAYSISKAVSEQLAWRLATERGLALTTVRPCAIYGAFDPNFTTMFRYLAASPVTVMPAWTRLALVYGGDVAEAIARVLERTESTGRAYNVTGEDLSLWEFWRAWNDALGRSAVAFPLPVPLSRTYDNGRAQGDLAWQNRPYVECLRETFAREQRTRT